jgi:hypothetical protein
VFVHSVYICMVLRPHFILPTVLSAVVARGAFYYQDRSWGLPAWTPSCRVSEQKSLGFLEDRKSGNDGFPSVLRFDKLRVTPGPDRLPEFVYDVAWPSSGDRDSICGLSGASFRVDLCATESSGRIF